MYTTLLAGETVYAIKCEDIESFCVLPKVEELPGSQKALRGNVSYRGSFIPLVGLRELFGQVSLLDQRKELAESLIQREKDHIDWLNDLRNSVINDSEFRKTTDPTKCAFGQWYYNFKTHDVQLARELKSLEEPHSDIHNLGVRVLNFVRAGDKEKALNLIKQSESTTLASLITQFARLRYMLVNEVKEVFVVIKNDNRRMGVAVDSILDIVHAQDIKVLATQIDLQSPFFEHSFQISKNKDSGDTSRVAHLLNILPILEYFNLKSSNYQEMTTL
jgi:chemotaxis signal transduction protein